MGKTLKIKIGGIITISFIDVINAPSLVIFFGFCNFKCPWCQNFPIVSGEKVYEIDIDEIIKRIEENKIIIEYVQASGGEPTLQKNALIELFKRVKEIGLKTSLDTNGSYPKVIKELIEKNLLDHLAMDVKFPLFSDFEIEKVIGTKIEGIKEKIIESLNIAKKLSFVEIRTTFVPTLVEEDEILKIASDISKISKKFFYVIQQFNPKGDFFDKKFSSFDFIPLEKLVEIGKNVKKSTGLKVFIRAREVGIKEI